MKLIPVGTSLVAAALSFSVYAVDCAKPQADIAVKRACEKFNNGGPDALRGFVWRTRMIYGLDAFDFTRESSQDIAQTGGVQIAEARGKDSIEAK
jgi:hypothetical protein